MIWYIKCYALVTMKYNPQQKASDRKRKEPAKVSNSQWEAYCKNHYFNVLGFPLFSEEACLNDVRLLIIKSKRKLNLAHFNFNQRFDVIEFNLLSAFSATKHFKLL